MPELYTTTEAAKIFHVHPQTVLRWIYTGNIAAVKIGGQWRIEAAEIKRVLGR